ncbi:serine/threonine-protein kinase [Streptomyces sp. SKN60]|uniref:serine/threonine-protein kinase n=1 Tax=Streptomyces sp. SKN60 TaxID=2855506 RepID=UPI0027E5004E|nr:serine/threonine-protein kinase [Streptomyces sp. SKN60]
MGVVHRDYKPGNVLVTTDGTSKLVDFGIAVRAGESGDIAGTPAYMAPEQWAGEPASPAGDVYAATATFFECLTAARPYAGTTLVELAVAHTEAAIPENLAPEALRPLIRSGLAKTPQQRPADAAALVAELEAVAGATYGPDWEERGKGQLAALVALLPLLLPSGSGQASGATSLATTELGGPGGSGGPSVPAGRGPRFTPQAKGIGAAAAGVVLLGGVLAGLSMAGADKATGTAGDAGPRPTTSHWPIPDVGPTGAVGASQTRTPSISASPAASASVPVPPTSVPPTSGSATIGTPQPSASVTAKPAPATAAPATSSQPPGTSQAPLRVDAISMTVACDGRYASQAEGSVTTNGAAAGTLTVIWTDEMGRQVGVKQLVLPENQTSVPFSFSQPFDSAEMLTARAATSPSAARGQNSTSSVFSFTCDPPR